MNEEQIPLDSPQDDGETSPTTEATLEEIPGNPLPEATGQDTEVSPPGEVSPDDLPPEEIIAQLQQELASHRQELAEQSEQLDSLKKRYVSLAAEFDNFRKRTQREKEEQSKVIKGKTITELLPVIDNFERARTQIKPNTDGENDIHKSYQGVYKSLVDSLKRLGVAPMRPEGKPFDPQYHEAMFREPTSEYAEDTVMEELVRGYVLEDLVLRHAMVKVAVAPEETSTDNGPSPASE